MSLTTPSALLLLLLIIPVAYVGWPRITYRRRRDTISLALRVAMLMLLVLALAGTQIVQSADRLAVIFLLDRSDSMGSSAQEAAEQYVRDALAEMNEDDMAGVVLFGGDAQVERPVGPSDELAPLRTVPSDDNTDIAEAIRLALALFPDNAARRIVILSDGQATVGDSIAAAQLARAANVEISYVSFSREPGPEVQVVDFRAPSVLTEGQQFDLIVTIRSEVDTPARITVLTTGAVVYEGNIDLREGTSNYTLPLTTSEAGFRDFFIQVTPLGENDGFTENNQMGTFTRVEGDPRVLVVRQDAADTQFLVPALEETGWQVDEITPDQLPTGAAPLVQYDSVILVNVLATDLGVSRMESLRTYVGDLGGGLLVIGGPEAYGPGGYGGSPLEEALPLEMRIRDQQRIPDLTIAYVIDRSGSMGALSPRGIAHIDLAKEAIIRSIDLLQETDRVAVASFDFDAYWIAPFQNVGQADGLQNLIATLRPGGGTSILAGMDLVSDAIVQEPAELKHIILLTDGGASSFSLVEMAERLNLEAGVTLSVISIGDFEPGFLADMAEAGQGNYHNVLDADEIPNIFAQETVLATRSYIIEDTFTPTASAINPESLHPIIRGIAALPELRGYVATTARPAAQVILRGPEPYTDPILAAWQYGLGRSVAFTSDATSRWAADWVSWDDYATFWNQAVQWTLTEGAFNNLETTIDMQGDTARIVVDARDDAGAFLNGLNLEARVVLDPRQPATRVILRQVAPGRYEGEFVPLGEGAHFIRVTGAGGDGAIYNQTNGWVMTYSPEYDIRSSDSGLMAQMADLTGGRSLADATDDVFIHNIELADATAPLWPWLLLAALLLLPFDIAVRRLVVTRTDMARLGAWIRRKVLPEREVTGAAERMASLREARLRAREQENEAAASQAAGRPSAERPSEKEAPASTPARAERPKRAPRTKPASPREKPQAGPRFTKPAPKVTESTKAESEPENIGARLLKKRRDPREE